MNLLRLCGIQVPSLLVSKGSEEFMRKWTAMLAAALVALGAMACKPNVRPIEPKRALLPGTVTIYFNRAVKGPVDLTIDGIRVPVTRNSKKPQHLVIKGLAPGQHRYFLSSPNDAFGPDQGEVEIKADKGIFLVAFAQGFKAVLYGSADSLPPAPGIPGVTAQLER